MNLNNVVQIDKDCYSIKYKNDLKDLNYIVNTGSHVHCLEDDNTYVYLGGNRWGLIKNKDDGSSEGSDLITETLQVIANGIYEAPEGKTYNQVEVEVPNNYAVSDEGKVVNNGVLVAQAAHATVTQNGTIDTTLNNSVTVNVPASTPVLEQLVVSENGTYTPDPGVDGFDEVVVDVDVNPNYVETISGTLGNPWGNADRAWLKSAVSGNEASAMMIVDGTAIGMQSITVLMSPTGSPSVLWFSASNYSEQFQTICLGWNTESGALNVAVALINGTTVDLSTHATAVHTTLTIIHHPMTGSLTPAENQTFGGEV